MRRLRLCVIIVSAQCLFLSCSDDDGPGQFIYPLEVGNVWYYTQTVDYVRDSSISAEFEEKIDVTVGAIETWAPYGLAYRLDIASHGTQEGSGAEFYQQSNAQLRRVGHCGAGTAPMATPKSGAPRAAEYAYLLAQLEFYVGGPCDVHGREGEPDQPVVLDYPWTIGNEWVFREVPEVPLTIRKRVSGWSNVKVPAGEYSAYQVIWSYDGFANLHVYDDVSAVGVVRRRVVADSIIITDYDHPEGHDTTYQSMITEMVLDSLRLVRARPQPN